MPLKNLTQQSYAANIHIQKLESDQLEHANRIVEKCVQGWDLTDKIKRLSIPSYRYNQSDFDYLMMFAAYDQQQKLVGVLALEYDLAVTLPGRRSGLLLHGLYVDPAFQHAGIGSKLSEFAVQQSIEQGFQGIWVKAQVDANGFFEKAGFEELPVVDPERDYLHRWWKSA